MEYRVDLRDLKFQLFDWLPLGELLEAERFADWDLENVNMVIDEAAKLAQEVIGPTNEEGDRIGSTWEDGKVTTPPSFKAAYDTYSEGGWVGCVSNPEYGGMGLPDMVGAAVSELTIGANMGFSLVTLLGRGASALIEDYGSDELKAICCEKMYSGEWAGTMCLTEPQAGSDVGASATKAVRQENGRYLISGEKIFITYGEHDLTGQIVHAVLARTPDAPPGTKGLSLFAVPKYRFTEDGEPGESNDVYCASIEHKMGIHGSPTCTMLFGREGGCEGYLLGQEGEGMRLMFDMMNGARIEVGIQGLATAGAAHEAACAYAHERLQMRHWHPAKAREAAQVPIVEHPDVRRMLLTSKAYVQAMRAIVLKTAWCLDKVHSTTGEERERYQGLVDLLTPICKAWCSDWGFRVTEWSLQVYGGYGYIREYPAEQYVRDAKITSIYEGTNGIQALDFVGRKLPARGGAPVRELLEEIGAVVEALGSDEELGEAARLLGGAAQDLGKTLQGLGGREDAALLYMLNAVPLLDAFGTVLGAAFLLEQARIARRRLTELYSERSVGEGEERRTFLTGNPDAAFLHNKVQSAIHFAFRALPLVGAQMVAARAGETAAMEAIL